MTWHYTIQGQQDGTYIARCPEVGCNMIIHAAAAGEATLKLHGHQRAEHPAKPRDLAAQPDRNAIGREIAAIWRAEAGLPPRTEATPTRRKAR